MYLAIEDSGALMLTVHPLTMFAPYSGDLRTPLQSNNP